MGRWFLRCPAYFSGPVLQREKIQKKITEMPSKRRFGNRPSQDRTDTRDTRAHLAYFATARTYVGTYICGS